MSSSLCLLSRVLRTTVSRCCAISSVRTCYLDSKQQVQKAILQTTSDLPQNVTVESSDESDLINALKIANEKYGVRKDPFATDFDLEFEPGPHNYPASFNAAGFVNRSPLLQEFVKMGVDLTVWDRKDGVLDYILRLDFKTEVQPYIRFLTDYGLEPEKLGWFFTRNPMILKEPLDDLIVRVNYLETKKFKPEMIARIINKNPRWLSFSTVKIDEHLGYFQKHFKLTGTEVRHVATVCPKVITQSLWKMETMKFTVWEEMGFTKEEAKKMLLAEPKIFLTAQLNMRDRFNYFHNVMKISHEAIVDYPNIFRTRTSRLRERHGFLKQLGRDQYDKTKEQFISLKKLISGTDGEFAVEVAESSVDAFNDFLKSN